jgi:hypothetical protein
LKHEGDKIISFERAGLLFIFNFHPTQSFTDYRLGVQTAGEYKVVLNTDSPLFMGHNRIDESGSWFTSPEPWNDRANSIQVRFFIVSTSSLCLFTKTYMLTNFYTGIYSLSYCSCLGSQEQPKMVTDRHASQLQGLIGKNVFVKAKSISLLARGVNKIE